MQRSIKRNLLAVNRVIIVILTIIFVILTYFRILLEIPDRFYNSIGIVTSVFIFLNVVIVLGAGIERISTKATITMNALMVTRSALPGITILFTIYLIAFAYDPWLATIFFNKTLIIAGPFGLLVGWVIVFLNRRDPQRSFEPNKITTEYFQSNFQISIILFVLFVIGIGLRLTNIAGYPPAIDELTHIKNAIYLIEGDPVQYFRSFWIVTLPIAGMFKFFGVSLFNARVVMVMINMFAIVPLYLLLSKFGKLTALAGVFLFVVNPSIVFMSQMARDYAGAPLFIFSVSYSIGQLLSLDINTGFGSLFAKSYKHIIFLLFILIWMLNDQASISAVVLASYAGFLCLLVIKFMFEFNTSRKVKIGSGLVILTLLFLFLSVTSKFMISRIRFEPKYFELLTSNQYVGWSSIFPAIGWIFLAWSVVLLWKSVKKGFGYIDYVTFFNASIFIVLMLYSATFLFAGKLAPNTKYYVVFVYFLIPIAAQFLSNIIVFLQKAGSDHFGSFQVIGTAILIIFFIGLAGIKANLEFVGGKNLVSDEYYLTYRTAYEFLIENIEPGDALLSDQLHKYDLIEQRLLDDVVVLGPSKMKREHLDLDTILSDHENGWVILSRNLKKVPDEIEYRDFSTSRNDFTYYGSLKSDFEIWHWQTVR